MNRADVHDETQIVQTCTMTSQRCVQERASDSGVVVQTCPLMQERRSLAKYRDLHVTLMGN